MLIEHLSPLQGYLSSTMHLVIAAAVLFFLMQSILHFKWNERGAAGDEGSWIDSAPDDIKSAVPQVELEPADAAIGKAAVMGPDPNVAKYKSAAEFFKGHNELSKLISAKGVIVPGEGATPETIAAFRKGIGVPDKPEGYKFTPVQNLHPAIKVTPEIEAQLKGVYYETGIPASTADKLTSIYLKVRSDEMIAADKAHNDKVQGVITQLTKDWGDQFPVKIQKMKTIAEKILGPQAIAELGDFSNNPAFLKVMDSMIAKLSEDTIKSFGINAGMSQGGGDSVETAKKFIQECNDIIAANDPKHPLNNENDPKHLDWVERRTKAYQTANPSGGSQ